TASRLRRRGPVRAPEHSKQRASGFVSALWAPIASIDDESISALPGDPSAITRNALSGAGPREGSREVKPSFTYRARTLTPHPTAPIPSSAGQVGNQVPSGPVDTVAEVGHRYGPDAPGFPHEALPNPWSRGRTVPAGTAGGPKRGPAGR